MGFFGWLGNLFDQLLAWLGRALASFIQALLNALEALWDLAIASILLAVYGATAVLYAIFYAGETITEVMMEAWDPQTNKPSQVFKIQQAPQNTPLPKQRSKARVVVLENWR